MKQIVLFIFIIFLLCSAANAQIDFHDAYTDTFTVCPSGCDYSNVQTAENGIAGAMGTSDLVGDSRSALVLVLGDWSAVGSGGKLDVDGWTSTDSTHNLSFRTEGMARFDGTYNISQYRLTGVGIMYEPNEPWTVLDGFTIVDSGTSAAGQSARLFNVTTPYDLLISNCLFTRLGHTPPVNWDFISFTFQTGGWQRVINCAFEGANSAGCEAFRIFNAGTWAILANNTINNCNRGLNNSTVGDSVYSLNTIFVDVDTPFFVAASYAGISDYNISDGELDVDGDYTPGANDIENGTIDLRNVSLLDFRIKTTSDAIDAALDLSSFQQFSFDTDVTGETRVGWDIGVDENNPKLSFTISGYDNKASYSYEFAPQNNWGASIGLTFGQGFTDRAYVVYVHFPTLIDSLRTMYDATGDSAIIYFVLATAMSSNDSIYLAAYQMTTLGWEEGDGNGSAACGVSYDSANAVSAGGCAGVALDWTTDGGDHSATRETFGSHPDSTLLDGANLAQNDTVPTFINGDDLVADSVSDWLYKGVAYGPAGGLTQTAGMYSDDAAVAAVRPYITVWLTEASPEPPEVEIVRRRKLLIGE